MNCPNCGAAMRLVDRRTYFACDYCATFHFPKSEGTSGEGVQLLDAPGEFDCPICQVRLASGLLDGLRVLHCRQCRGILMQNGTFATLVRLRRSRYVGGERKPLPLDPREFSRQVICPACHKAMDTHPYYGPGSVVVDTCSQCVLIWLDYGELTAIEQAPGNRGWTVPDPTG